MRRSSNRAQVRSVLSLPRGGPLLVWIWAAAVCLGCRSVRDNTPRSSSMVSMAVHNSRAETIRLAALEVFKADLYETTYAGPEHLVFEKPGTLMSDLAYGGWMDSDVWIRVKIDITQYGATSHLVECDAFAVTSRGESFFEDERRLSKFSRKPYKRLLEKIRDKASPAGLSP